MGTNSIILFPPLLDQYLGLFQCIKDFSVEQLISELAVEQFVVTIFPRAARLNIQGLDLQFSQSFVRFGILSSITYSHLISVVTNS